MSKPPDNSDEKVLEQIDANKNNKSSETDCKVIESQNQENQEKTESEPEPEPQPESNQDNDCEIVETENIDKQSSPPDNHTVTYIFLFLLFILHFCH